jgi:hypothetical protein
MLVSRSVVATAAASPIKNESVNDAMTIVSTTSTAGSEFLRSVSDPMTVDQTTAKDALVPVGTVLLDTDITPSYQSGYAECDADAKYKSLREGCVLALFPKMGATQTLRDFSGHGHDVVLNAGDAANFSSSPYGQRGLEITSTLDDYEIAAELEDVVPKESFTCAFGVAKTDGTNRGTAIIGNGTNSVGFKITHADSSGDFQMNWGGSSEGVNRITVANEGYGGNRAAGNFVATTGGRGMELWQQGKLYKNYSATPSRPDMTGNNLTLGSGGNNDLVIYDYVIMWNRQLTTEEIVLLESTDGMAFLVPEENIAQEIVPSGPQIYSKTVTDAMTIIDVPAREIPISVSDVMTVSGSTEIPPEAVSHTMTIVDTAIDYLEIFGGYAMSHTLGVADSFWSPSHPFVDDVMSITQTVVEQKVGQQLESVSQPCGVNHTVSYCFGTPWSAISITDALGLTSSVGLGIPVAVVDAMSIVQEMYQANPLNHFLGLTQVVSYGRAYGLADTMTIVQTLEGESDFPRTVTDTGVVSDAVAYYFDDPCTRKNYNRYGDIPAMKLTFDANFVLESLSGTKQTLSMRSPETDDRRKIGFQRVNRETRGGELGVYRDPAWPDVQTLGFTIVALADGVNCPDKINALLAFFQSTLGQEILIHDWEGITWRGVVTTPNETAVEDQSHWWTMSFEFEGIELDGSGPDQRMEVEQTVAANWERVRTVTDALTISEVIAISGILPEADTDAMNVVQALVGEVWTPILEDDFSGAGAALHGTSPDVGSATWTAHSNYLDNGTQTAINAGAYYPFVPVSGKIYHIEWEPRSLAENSYDETTFFLGEGLPVGTDPVGPTAYGKSDPTTLKAGFVLRDVASTQRNACRLGDYYSGIADTVDFTDGTLKAEADDIDLRLVLDTRLGAGFWKATWYAKDTGDSTWTQVRAQTNLIDENITMVGWANDNTTTTVTMNSISIIEKVSA